MEQIRRIIEAGAMGLVKDPVYLSEMATRDEKQVIFVEDGKYSFLMVLKDGSGDSQIISGLNYYSKHVERIKSQDLGKVLTGIFSVKKDFSNQNKVVHLWSPSPHDATLLYNLGVRIWGSLVSDSGEASSVKTLLTRLKRLNEGSIDNTYNCRPGMRCLPYDKDVKILKISDTKEQDVVVKIAKELCCAHSEMFQQHDELIDVMQQFASMMGLPNMAVRGR